MNTLTKRTIFEIFKRTKKIYTKAEVIKNYSNIRYSLPIKRSNRDETSQETGTLIYSHLQSTLTFSFTIFTSIALQKKANQKLAFQSNVRLPSYSFTFKCQDK